MKTQILIHKLIPRTFDLVKVNQVLVMPFLMFLLLVIVVLSPVVGINPFILVAVIALKSVFLSGWLNMFHMCLENTNNENLSDEQKTLNSLNLYKEFFPGVGKYFQKIFWGVLIFLLVVNLVESVIFHFLGNFKSFSLENLPQTLGTKADFISFWNKINHVDKIKILKIAAIDMSFVGVLSYLTMFWTQSVVAEEKNPINAFIASIKTVLNDPINTFLIFAFMIISFIFVFGLNLVLGENIIGQLLTLMLFAYVIVYYTMMTFLYFERYR
ncbi:MAG: hypothetical protein A2039_03150 [Candidatus Melainabacteria bacterium GWA2_34_9]|nr:MAG: hypothetical protein A2039_03150 [Candidatus Melainabacteria bacterium GWA2_34_9]